MIPTKIPIFSRLSISIYGHIRRFQQLTNWDKISLLTGKGIGA